MKKLVCLSVAASFCLHAANVELGTIEVEEKIETEVIKDVSNEEIKSADVAEGLAKESSSVWLVRRSGISNDIIVRGQKKDNINVTIDGTKVFGACPNRMDPAISHMLTNNIESIELIEGPYNVEDFGVLSADVKVHTKKPTKETTGEVNLGFGSWGYKKASFNVSGGGEKVKFLLSGSTESGEQYEDGDGNDFVEQIAENGLDASGSQYQPKYQNLDAFEKKTVMAKLFWNIADNQELRLSYTANRSDDILYPSSKMDALYDDSDIFNIEYSLKDLGKYSKALDVQLYQSEVDHPMSTLYRKAATALADEITHHLDTKTQGAKIKNSFDVENHTVTAGLDYSLRNWDGAFYKNGVYQYTSLSDVDTENYALFLKDTFRMDKLEWNLGLRYDDTEITSGLGFNGTSTISYPVNDYSELNGYISGTYHADENTQYFAGIGKSSRVPDARELYIFMKPAGQIGSLDLENTVNYELDAGIEKKFENASFKAKAFYSMLKDFIAYNSSNTTHVFENVDATIYGLELSGTYVASESLYFDYGMSYQRGKKDDPLTGQTDTDLPEIPPLKFNAAANYLYDESLSFRAELIAADEWSRYDYDNGEQELDAYAVLNLKGTKQLNKNLELTVGIDNVFDSTYATANTYEDLTLLGSGITGEVMLLNEPGRYIYTNIKYKF
ncbi:MAG: TonB-dependent receptor [Sulfurovum sp.]|nr:TonB-dependent receptor [Sulfurovum sp.]